MTYEEARDVCGIIVSAEINELSILYRHDDAQELEEAKNLMLSALEKQIPKKPINKTGLNNTTALLYENCSIVVCPECRGRLKLKSKGKYCDKCGQAIDWECE